MKNNVRKPPRSGDKLLARRRKWRCGGFSAALTAFAVLIAFLADRKSVV